MTEGLLLGAESAARTVLVIATMRSTPIVVRFSASANGFVARLAVICAFVLMSVGVSSFADFALIGVMVAYGYFAVAATAIYALSHLVRARLVLFAASLGLMMAAPSLAEARLRPAVLVLGWDFMLACYSYVTSASAPRSILEFLDFVLVNPALVYAHRGTRVGLVSLEARGLLRSALGACLIFLSEMVPYVGQPLREHTPVQTSRLVAGALVFIQLYSAHSGVASLQIGLCRQLGLMLPERYLKPLGASSPKEFWRRWNTYVGTWTRIYVFQPTTLYLRRRWKVGGALPWILATLVSFTCVGVLHDLFTFCKLHQLNHSLTPWFAVNGLVVVVWEAIARLVRRRMTRLRWPSFGGPAMVIAIAVLMSAARS